MSKFMINLELIFVYVDKEVKVFSFYIEFSYFSNICYKDALYPIELTWHFYENIN